jgi:hypothetical protein
MDLHNQNGQGGNHVQTNSRCQVANVKRSDKVTWHEKQASKQHHASVAVNKAQVPLAKAWHATLCDI